MSASKIADMNDAMTCLRGSEPSVMRDVDSASRVCTSTIVRIRNECPLRSTSATPLNVRDERKAVGVAAAGARQGFSRSCRSVRRMFW